MSGNAKQRRVYRRRIERLGRLTNSALRDAYPEHAIREMLVHMPTLGLRSAPRARTFTLALLAVLGSI